MKNELHLTHPMNVKGMNTRRKKKKDCSATISAAPSSILPRRLDTILCFEFYKLCIYFIFTVSLLAHVYMFYQLPISLSFKRRQVESVQFIQLFCCTKKLFYSCKHRGTAALNEKYTLEIAFFICLRSYFLLFRE